MDWSSGLGQYRDYSRIFGTVTVGVVIAGVVIAGVVSTKVGCR